MTCENLVTRLNPPGRAKGGRENTHARIPRNPKHPTHSDLFKECPMSTARISDRLTSRQPLCTGPVPYGPGSAVHQ
ncbi:hypothetical protein SHIRM173S_06784 [Streptomyces hirsutus]